MGDVNIPSLCRICLEEGAIHPLFEKNENGDSLLTKLSLCVSEKVEDIEGFPRHICSTCNTTLDTLSNFIYKYRKSYKIIENGLKIVKNEEYTDNSKYDIPDVEIDIKTESNSDDFDASLASLVKHTKTKVKIKKQWKKKQPVKVKSQSENKTNAIASSLLGGNFMWTGEKWCMKIGDTVLTKKSCRNIEDRPRPQTKIKVPKETKVPTEKLCDICGDVFKTQEKLAVHKRNVHSNKSPVQCPKCPRKCVSTYYLNRHIKRKHETTKDFICSNCGQGFAFKGELTGHIRNVHAKHLLPKKVYACKFCDKTYKCAKSVVVHERSVHTGQRPAECSICDSRFYHIDYLKEHMRLHTGETPFKCPICGRGYAQRCNMKSHLRIHRISELDPITLSKMRPNYLKLLKV